MKHSKDYEINKWSNWFKELVNAAQDFYNTFNALPNIIEANEHTFSQFEFITEISPVGQEIKNVKTELLGNKTKNPRIRELEFKDQCTLTFIVKDNFPDKKYRLKLEQRADKKALVKKVKVKKRNDRFRELTY